MRTAPAVYVVAGETQAQAEDKRAVIDSLVKPIDGLVPLFKVLNLDFPSVCSPTQIADQMEEWFGRACYGLVISAAPAPGSYEDFVRLVVPELQRRGLFRREYEGKTLRENLGIARPGTR